MDRITKVITKCSFCNEEVITEPKELRRCPNNWTNLRGCLVAALNKLDISLSKHEKD